MSDSSRISDRRRDDIAFAALAQTSPEAIVTMDERRSIVGVNPATETLLGYSATDLIGRPLSILIPERMRVAHERGVTRFLATGQPSMSWTGVRVAVLTKDGREIPVEIAFGTFADAAGHRYLSGFIRDVSDWVKHERELDAARKVADDASREATMLAHITDRALAQSEQRRTELEAALRIRDEVLSVVSHDLRNPLNAIVTSATFLQEPDIEMPEAERHHLIDVIERSAQRMNRLILDLMDVGRIETGRFSVQRRSEDPAAIVRDVCDEFRSVAEQHGQALTCQIATNVPTVLADHDRVVQLLSNYLNNAVKFTPKGGRISVELSVDSACDVLFAVRDTGPGIPADDLKHVFDGFWQADRTAHLGAGLGLGIARGVAAAHGGTVWAESEVGEGSTFCFRLPSALHSQMTRPKDAVVPATHSAGTPPEAAVHLRTATAMTMPPHTTAGPGQARDRRIGHGH